MSPNAYLSWDFEARMLRGYPGETEGEAPSFTWSYSDFEEFTREAITPSMYEYMCDYVQDNISKENLYDIQAGVYYSGELEEEAVDAYFELPILERIKLHDDMMVKLKLDQLNADRKDVAYSEADCPFDSTSPIYEEYCKWREEGHRKWENEYCVLDLLIQEESNWCSGAEEGAENKQQMYDPVEV
jgi:hypothetical protein